MSKFFLGDPLIFIISQPRAGSTLLQRILAGHPQVQSSSEPWLMLHPIYALKREGIQTEYNAQWANTALQDFLKYYADGEETYLQAIRAFADVLYRKALINTNKKYFLDKTPRYYFIIPELFHLFPEAKFIFLIRNPLAVLYSIIENWVIPVGWSNSFMYKHDLVTAPSLIVEGSNLIGKNSMVIHYENLVKSPNQTVATLCNKIGISFNSEMLHYANNPIPKGRTGDRIGIVNYKEPSTKSLNKWKKLADLDQTKNLANTYLDILGPNLIKKLGYSDTDLKNAINSPTENEYPSLSIIPWDIIMKPEENWSSKEKLIYNRAISIQKEGLTKGFLLFLKNNYQLIIKSTLANTI